MSATSATSDVEAKEEIEGHQINYARAGSGAHNLLCLSGAIGCWVTDFKRVVEEYDHSKFTIVAWDPPGYGKSRPPDRNFAHGANIRDAKKAHLLMKQLGLLPYSILGWSDGGITALNVAYQQRDTTHITKLVIWGATAYVTEDQMKVYRVMKDTANWGPASRQKYIDLYGEEYFVSSWRQHVESRMEIFTKYAGDKCKQILPDITQPVLIIHGGRDIFVRDEHPRYLKAALPNARVSINKTGSHSLHNDLFFWFKDEVEKFLLSDESNTSCISLCE